MMASSSDLPVNPASDVSAKHRPDIDGLRAVAVMGVLIYHLKGSALSGGFVGVDVFFVISGFLISAIIDREIRAKTFSITRFYDRRIRRIFPAFFGMICAVMAASWFILLPDDMLAFAKSIRYAVAGMSNILFLRDSQDYFNESVSPIPLLHTWSLGVEEQFYLFFPLLLGVTYRFLKSTARRMGFLAVLCVVSLAASAVVVGEHPMKAFFLLPYRAWELLLGTLVALCGLPVLSKGMNNVLGLAGIGMIAASMVLFNETIPFPGLSALIPCVGTALLLWTGRVPHSWSGRLLSAKPVVFVGLISYSVYLWHWPMIALAKYLFPGGVWTAGLILAGSLIGGYLSWRFIEQPFRVQGFCSRAKVFSLWAASSVCLLGFGSLIDWSAGFPNRYPTEVRQLLSFKVKPAHWKDTVKNERDLMKAPVYGASGVAPGYALWGDSHGTAIVPVLEAMAREKGQSFRKFGQGALAPVVGVVQTSESNPGKQLRYSQAVLDLLLADKSIHTVFFHARWSLYCKGQNEIEGASPVSFYGYSFQSQKEAEEFYAGQIRHTVNKLVEGGKRVVLIYPVPEVGVNVPDLLAKRQITGKSPVSSVACANFFERQSLVIEVLDSLGNDGRIVRIKPHEMLLHDGQITVRNGGQVLYMDDDHLSSAGALYLKPLFSNAFDGAPVGKVGN